MDIAIILGNSFGVAIHRMEIGIKWVQFVLQIINIVGLLTLDHQLLKIVIIKITNQNTIYPQLTLEDKL